MSIESVDEYIAMQPTTTQPLLQAIRAAIRAAVPALEEGLSYQLPTYKVPGLAAGVIHVGAWKKHLSLYPATERVLDVCSDELAALFNDGGVVEKGTIKLPLDRPVPVALIAQMTKVRTAEVTEAAAAKTATKKTATKTAAKKTATKKTAAKKTAAKKTAATSSPHPE